MMSYRLYRSSLWTVYTALALFVFVVSFLPGSAYIVDNTATPEPQPPVAYRVLVPAMTDALYALLPASLEQPLADTLVRLRDTQMVTGLIRLQDFYARHNYQTPPTLTPERIVYSCIKMLVAFAWFMAFLAMLSCLMKAFFPQSEACSVTACLLFLLLLPVFLCRYAYSYDFAELFFACACMYLLYRERWLSYLICLAVATCNKETTVFMVFFFAVWYSTRMPRQLYLRLLGLQILIVAAVLTVIMAQFSHVAVTHGGAGLMFFYYVTMRHIGFSFGYSYYTFMCGVVMLVLLAHRWQEKPAFLLGGMWMVLANAVVYVVSCNIGEYRDLFWSMPVMVMLSAHSIVMLTDMDKWPLFARFTPSST